MTTNAWILSGMVAGTVALAAALPERRAPAAEAVPVVVAEPVVRTYALATADADAMDHLLTRVYQPATEGGPAALRAEAFAGRLVVRADPRVHDEVAALLGELDRR